LVSVLDRFFLGRAWPNIRSWASLGVVSLGALAYVITDANFEVNAYGWVGVWYACFAFDAGTCRAFPKSKRDVYRPRPSALRP
jgi:solute carrier family 35 protein